MTDLPADRYIEEALRRVGRNYSVEAVKLDYARLGVYRALIELARMIEKHEPIPEPVDPDLLIAREAAADSFPNGRVQILNGEWDAHVAVLTALRAIKLAREKGAL